MCEVPHMSHWSLVRKLVFVVDVEFGSKISNFGDCVKKPCTHGAWVLGSVFEITRFFIYRVLHTAVERTTEQRPQTDVTGSRPSALIAGFI